MANDSQEGDENKERGNWTGRLDFLLSCVGYAVGLGNIWRFPYLCYRNGGASFLIPYAVMLIFAGLPIFLFELTLGQFSSQGPVTAWKVSPLFQGIGWGMVCISSMVCIYYNTIIAYAIYYMMVAFVNMDSVLPWTKCGNSWNTGLCKDTPYPNFDAMEGNETGRYDAVLSIMNNTCAMSSSLLDKFMNTTKQSGLQWADINSTSLLSKTFDECRWSYKSPSDEYWNRQVLNVQESNGIGDLGGMSWKLFVSLLFAWVIVFFCLMKGIKSSGRVVYFTATFPYVILVVLLIRGLTLEGYMKGIRFYIIPNDESWERLKDPKVWGDAATQIFYSLGPAFGSLLTMSSYNRFKNNCYRDAIIVALINCGTSVFAGFVIFSLLGFMAHETNQRVEDVATSGPGLTFIAYPAGIAQLPGAPVWAFLFFFMILTLGLDSQFGMMEAVLSGISDVFPTFLRKHKTLYTFVMCCIGFGLAIPQATFGGIYILTLMDWYSGSYGLMIVCFFELMAVCWVYGIRNFFADFKMMLGFKPGIYWLATWFAVTPAIILFILVMTFVNYSKAYYGDVEFEDWAQGVGWAMVALPVVAILLSMLVQSLRYMKREKTSFLGGVRAAARHTDDWGPALNIHRAIDPDRYPPLPDEETPSQFKMQPVNNGYPDVKSVDNKGFEADDTRM